MFNDKVQYWLSSDVRVNVSEWVSRGEEVSEWGNVGNVGKKMSEDEVTKV